MFYGCKCESERDLNIRALTDESSVGLGKSPNRKAHKTLSSHPQEGGHFRSLACREVALNISHSRYIYLSLLANSPTDLMHQAGELPVMGNFPRQTDCKAGGE